MYVGLCPAISEFMFQNLKQLRQFEFTLIVQLSLMKCLQLIFFAISLSQRNGSRYHNCIKYMLYYAVVGYIQCIYNIV